MSEAVLKKCALALQSSEMVKIANGYFPFSVSLTIPRIIFNPLLTLQLPHGMDLELMRRYMSMGSAFIEGRYSSPEELLDEVKKFMDFQGNHQFFGLDGSVHYCHTPKVYQEKTTGKQFICKNDIYAYMQNYLLKKEPELEYRPIIIMLSYFFKSQEKKLAGTTEFVQFGKQESQSLERQLDDVLPKTQGHQLLVIVSEFNFENYLKKFKKVLPEKMTDEQMYVFIGVLKNLFTFRELGKLQSIRGISYMLHMCTEMIPRLQKIIDRKPEWFLPKDRDGEMGVIAKLAGGINNLMVTPAKPAIRLLEDSGTFYVFASELEAAMSQHVEIQWAQCAPGTIGVIEYEAALGIMEYHDMKPDDVEFVVIPVERTKHSVVPISTGNGNFCKPSADVFLEFAKDLFFGFTAFQKKREDLWKKFEEEIIVPLYTVFYDNNDEVYFLDNRIAKSINCSTLGVITPDNSPKTICPVPRQGFTAEDVVNQLKQLTVDSYFPDIFYHVDTVYKKVKGKKNQDLLKTSHMYDVIEGCFLISFLKKFPEFAAFFHTQGACHRIPGYQCDKCEGQKENPKPNQSQMAQASKPAPDKQHFLHFFVCENDNNSVTVNGVGKAQKVMKIDVLANDLNLIVENIPDDEPIEPKI